MKWQKKDQTATEGLLYVESIVNAHGLIFRRVHQEHDIGIDGHIELVQSEVATGKLIAIQVKSGDSYLSGDGQEFNVSVDQDHLDYWSSYPLPVVLVCYSPSKDIAAWECIQTYIDHEKYRERTPITRIRIWCFSAFDVMAINEKIAALAETHADRRILVQCVDKCLVGDTKQRLQGISILAAHPDSRDSRTVAFLARRLLFDSDAAVADEAIYTLAHHVGRFRWSWNPNNVDEHRLIQYASQLCRDFTPLECRKLIERIDNEEFGGPDALGERVFDLLSCCLESQDVMYNVIIDKSQPMNRRMKALYMFSGCDDDELLERRDLADDPKIGDVYREMFAEELNESK